MSQRGSLTYDIEYYCHLFFSLSYVCLLLEGTYSPLSWIPYISPPSSPQFSANFIPSSPYYISTTFLFSALHNTVAATAVTTAATTTATATTTIATITTTAAAATATTSTAAATTPTTAATTACFQCEVCLHTTPHIQ